MVCELSTVTGHQMKRQEISNEAELMSRLGKRYLETIYFISNTTSQQPVVELVMLFLCRGQDSAKLHLPPHRTE